MSDSEFVHYYINGEHQWAHVTPTTEEHQLKTFLAYIRETLQKVALSFADMILVFKSVVLRQPMVKPTYAVDIAKKTRLSR